MHRSAFRICTFGQKLSLSACWIIVLSPAVENLVWWPLPRFPRVRHQLRHNKAIGKVADIKGSKERGCANKCVSIVFALFWQKNLLFLSFRPKQFKSDAVVPLLVMKKHRSSRNHPNAKKVFPSRKRVLLPNHRVRRNDRILWLFSFQPTTTAP